MKIRIEQDTDPLNPRTEWDNIGTMVCFHQRYTLGDEDHDYDAADYDGWDEIKEAIRKEEDVAVILPLYLYDHSGITINTRPFSCPWDSGQVGFIFVSKKKLRYEFSRKRISASLEARAKEILEGEVQTYDQYLTGDVWGYVIEDDNGEPLESCWGFFGREYCEEQAKEALEYQEAQEAQREPSMVPAPVCASA